MKTMTDEEIEMYALSEILDNDIAEGFMKMKAWIEGAIWMRDEMYKMNDSKQSPCCNAGTVLFLTYGYYECLKCGKTYRDNDNNS